MKKIIAPSILAADLLNLGDQINELNNISDLWYHLDIMDGHFVPNLSYGTPLIKSISKMAKHPLDAHLMVTNPELHIELLKDLSIHNFTFHFEAVDQPTTFAKKIKNNFSSVGISIKPKTKVSNLSLDLINVLDLILVMSVEPGFGGQSFQDSSLEKVKELCILREKYNLNFKIQIDGGINNVTANKAIEAGADNLVSGSYIFRSDDLEKQIESLR